MFTGIVTDIGTISQVEQRGDMRLVIDCHYDMASVAIGASIACSGVCLTVAEKGEGSFTVDVSAETVSRTARAMWREGATLNLERALKVGDELGGHIVTGHVDAVGEVLSVTDEGDSKRIVISAGKDIAPSIAPKGSVTLNGVSLTVNEVQDVADGVQFGINIIPHTSEVTTFAGITPGQAINIEIDVLARYLARMRQLTPAA